MNNATIRIEIIKELHNRTNMVTLNTNQDLKLERGKNTQFNPKGWILQLKFGNNCGVNRLGSMGK
jgi:hypothetical protein